MPILKQFFSLKMMNVLIISEKLEGFMCQLKLRLVKGIFTNWNGLT